MSNAARRKKIQQLRVKILAGALLEDMTEELDDIKHRRKRRWWVKPWIAQREQFGASTTLLNEWVRTCPEDLSNHLRMSAEDFSYLLEKVSPKIAKQDTRYRKAIPARAKLEMTLRYLSTGDNLNTLGALYRIPKPTFSRFFPEVCRAIYEALEDFIQVCSSLELPQFTYRKVKDLPTRFHLPFPTESAGRSGRSDPSSPRASESRHWKDQAVAGAGQHVPSSTGGVFDLGRSTPDGAA